ncbi:palmitoyl-(protein) hydrolase [Aureococcus anophagefferens]|nr:palmitoyl-(protein) hydrolase [Aureococcus anophagefferens]
MASFDRSAILEIEETTRDHNRHDRSDVMHEVYSATAEELVDANGVEIRALSRLGEAPAADGSAVAVCALRCGEAVWEAYRERCGDERALCRRLTLSAGARARRGVVAEHAGFESDFGAGAAAQKLAHGIWEKTMKRARQAVSADAKASRVLGDAVGRELQRLGHAGAALDDGDASAGPWCGGCGVELGAGPPNWVRVCGGRGCGALVCEGCCDQGGFFRKAAEAKARCQGCRARAARREILDGWASADSRRVALTRLGRAFASVDAAGAGRVGRHLFGKLLLGRGTTRPPPDVPAVLFDEVGDDGDFEDVFEEAGAAPSTFGAIASALGALAGAKPPRSPKEPKTPAAGSKKHRRRSVRFSDADEVEVSRGFAFDRVVKQDGSVKWEVSTPRRAKSAWRTVVRLVIRPPRASYDVGELGPLSFEIPSLRDAQKKLACVRSDFTVLNDDGLKLACSLWSRVLDADDFDDRAKWRRPGKASTEKRPKAFEKPCVLYLHGNASCRLECLPHVAPLLMLGLRVCAVDTSGSGLSEGEFVTLGEREAKDAACVAAHLVAAKRASVVALYGRSMGGVAAILGARSALGGAARVVACVVADSPFASLAGLAAGFFAGLSARGALAESAAKAAIDAVTAEVKKRAALDVASVDASLAVAALDAPLLLVAANGDQLIPPRPNAGALLKLYANAKTGPKKSQRQRDAELLLALKAPTKDRGGEFRSGMTDAREKAIARDISHIFCG